MQLGCIVLASAEAESATLEKGKSIYARFARKARSGDMLHRPNDAGNSGWGII
jgi:hypothetical protein